MHNSCITNTSHFTWLGVFIARIFSGVNSTEGVYRLEPPADQPNGHTANGTPAQPEPNDHHGRHGTPEAAGKERPLAPTLREPESALYDALG